MEELLKKIEEIIRTTIVIQNPKGVKFCMKKIKKELEDAAKT